MAILSLATACVMDAVYGRYSGKETGETALLRSILGSLQKGDVAEIILSQRRSDVGLELIAVGQRVGHVEESCVGQDFAPRFETLSKTPLGVQVLSYLVEIDNCTGPVWSGASEAARYRYEREKRKIGKRGRVAARQIASAAAGWETELARR